MAESASAAGSPQPASPAPTVGTQPGAALAPTLALTLSFAAASIAVVLSVALLVVHPTLSQVAGFAALLKDQQAQGPKTALYLGSFLVVLPVAVTVVPRVADAIATGPNRAGLPVLAGLLTCGFLAVIVLVKVSARLPWGSGLGTLLAASAIWWVVAVALHAHALRGGRLPALLSRSGSAPPIWRAAGVLLFGAILCVTTRRGLNDGVLGLGAVLVVVVAAALDRGRPRRAGKPSGALVDILLLFVLLLAVPDVVIFHTSAGIPNPFFPPGVIQFHHDFLLGPANQVLGGGALLVDDPVSQYGVGSIYFLAGWFHITPIGYGTYGALDGILTAGLYAGGYCSLRLAGVSRLLAGSALALGVTTLIYNLTYPVGALPQQGPLRFGLPLALILATLAGLRWPRRVGLARATALTVLGVSAVWALEAFAYTAATYAVMTAVQVWLLPVGGRLGAVRRHGLLALGAIVSAHLVLLAATLAGTGELPHWGQYVAYIKAFLLGGKAGEITYGFARWSPGVAVGAADLASAAILLLLLRRRPDVMRARPAVSIALAGMTTYSTVLFSYSDNRSSTYLLPYVALPLLLTVALWLTLTLRAPSAVPRGVRRGTLAFAMSVAVLMLAAAWGSIGTRFSDSALAHAYPGGGLGRALHRLWHPPPIDPRATAGQQLLDRYMPGQRRSIVLLPATTDLSIEILIRSGRSSTLPLGDPKADSFVPSVALPALRRAVDKLRSGDRLLLDRVALQRAVTLAAEPTFDPSSHTSLSFNPLEDWVLQRIGERFTLRELVRGGAGFVVAQLAPKV